MKIHKPLNEIFGNETKIKILRTLFHYPGEFTGRHISRLCNLSHAPVQRNLQILADNDILKVSYVGTSKVFSLNKDNIMYKPLKTLFLAEESFGSKLIDLIRDYIEQNKELWNLLVHVSLYGSILEREEEARSDVDLYLLFKKDIAEGKALELFNGLERKINKLYGNALHLYVDSLEVWLKKPSAANKRLKNSKLIYGKELDKVKETWQKSGRRKQT